MIKKIVIIEDETSISEMYKFKLEAEGYDVTTAANSWDGLVLVDKVRPDLLLLDIMMPYETGDVTLEKLRATEFGKNLKVIMMTNTEAQDASPTIKQLGIKRFVIKATMTPAQVAIMVKDELADKRRVAALATI